MLEQIKLQHPRLGRDTFILFICLILPYLLAVGICIEQLVAKNMTNKPFLPRDFEKMGSKQETE